jgi:geranylgeranyl diphosphate synthase, type I
MPSVTQLVSDSPVTGTQSPGQLFADARRRVGAVLDEFLAAKSADAPDSCLPPVVDAVRETVSGGKRLRPLFCLCGWLAGGGRPETPVVARTGAALELFHAFALIHDDIMDGSERRRGRPAMHRLLAGLHPDQADPRAAGRFGVNAAILAGDLCLVWSEELLHTAKIPPARLRAVRPLLDAMRTEVMAGQYLDLVQRPHEEWLARAWRTIGLKTAGYTVERPLQIGAVLAGDDPAVLRLSTGYGRPLGEAFQLRDDLLGVFGDPAVTGKPVLDDLREGKPTVLMALTWQRASASQRETLRELHGDPLLDETGARVLRELIHTTGADKTVEELIETRTAQALSALAGAPVPANARQALADLATLVATRDH